MKWVLIVIGAIILLPLIIRILLPIIKALFHVIAWLLTFAFGVGGIVMLVNGEALYGIIGLVIAGVLGSFIPKLDFDINDYI